MRRLLALLSALACAASLALVGAPAHASGINLVHDRYEWDHLGHQITVDIDYLTIYGRAYDVQSVTLQCDPADSTKWGSGNNVDGIELSWGAYNGTTYNVYKSILNGGNIGDCTDTYTYDMENGDTIPNSSWSLRIKYHFATNYNNPDNNVQPSIYFDTSGGGVSSSSCMGNVTLHGAGSIAYCTVLSDYPVG